MNLRETLAKVEPGTVIAVGAKNSFMYIGKVDPEKIEREFSEYRDRIEEYFSDFKQRIKYDMESLEKHLNRIREYGNKYGLPKHIECSEDIELYDGFDTTSETTLNRMKDLRTAIRCSKTNALYLHSYIPVMDREVKAVYQQKGSDYALVIIVEGTEQGSYWMESEYAEKKKPEKAGRKKVKK